MRRIMRPESEYATCRSERRRYFHECYSTRMLQMIQFDGPCPLGMKRMEEPCNSIVATLQNCWSTAFAKRDLANLVALYTENTVFYGSQSQLYRGHDGVRSYFSALSPHFKTVQFGSSAIISLAQCAIASSGPVYFVVEKNGRSRQLFYRMTHVLVEQSGRWLIATHHASPQPPPFADSGIAEL